MAITYSLASNRITVIGGTESVPYAFADIYAADKAGALELFSGTPTTNITLSQQVRPAQEIALKIDFITSDATDIGVGDTIDITGTDKDDNVQNETLITESNNTFTTAKWFKTITDIDCNGFVTGNLAVSQNQWGVIGKQGDSQYKVFCKFYIGDGSADTWFADSRKQIEIADGIAAGNGSYIFAIRTNAQATFGELEDLESKTTKNGCSFILQESTYISNKIIYPASGTVCLYSCSFIGGDLGSSKRSYLYLTYGGAHRVWNCNCNFYVSILGTSATTDIYNLVITKAMHGFLNIHSDTTVDQIFISGCNYLTYLSGNRDVTFSNLISKNNNYIIQTLNWVGTGYFVDCVVDNWNFLWSGTNIGNIYRQYTFNLKVTSKSRNIDGATIILEDKDGNTTDQKGFETTTNASGEIAEQTVSYGYYNQANGNTLQSYSPHTLIIRKKGYQPYAKVFNLDEKINWRVSLTRSKINVDQGVI